MAWQQQEWKRLRGGGWPLLLAAKRAGCTSSNSLLHLGSCWQTTQLLRRQSGRLAELGIFNPKTQMGLERILKGCFLEKRLGWIWVDLGMNQKYWGRITRKQIMVEYRILFSCLLWFIVIMAEWAALERLWLLGPRWVWGGIWAPLDRDAGEELKNTWLCLSPERLKIRWALGSLVYVNWAELHIQKGVCSPWARVHI